MYLFIKSRAKVLKKKQTTKFFVYLLYFYHDIIECVYCICILIKQILLLGNNRHYDK